jgi:hypothetical protein
MKDEDKTKKQLIAELLELRRHVHELRQMRLAAGKGLKIGEILIDMRLLTDSQVKEFLDKQKASNNKRFGEIMIEAGIITGEQLDLAIDEQLRRLKSVISDRQSW